MNYSLKYEYGSIIRIESSVKPVAVVPHLLSFATDTDGLAILLTFDVNMSNPAAYASDFTVKVGGVSVSIDRVSLEIGTKIITIYPTYNFNVGDVITFSIASGNIKSADGVAIDAIVDQPITNNATNTHYFIATTGSNAASGKWNAPWLTLTYACAHATTSGDTIHVNAGTYTETSQSSLAVGVSIEGDGVTSVIKAGAALNPLILMPSGSDGTNGNQSISHLKFDGNSLTGRSAILCLGRSNVKVHNCTFIDFSYHGIDFWGRADGGGTAPSVYATGNEFYNNDIRNCARYSAGYGEGALEFGGQVGILINDNYMEQTGRSLGTNGWLIKSTGFIEAIKIYNNTIIKEPFDNTTFDFAIELWNTSLGGHEIYNNTIVGNTDLNDMYKGTYAFGCWFHHNIVGHDSDQLYTEVGFELEGDCENVIVENNYFKNLDTSIKFQHSTTKYIKDIDIRYNVFDKARVFSGGGSGTPLTRDVRIFNNTINGSASDGMEFFAIGTYEHFEITNNIITNNTRSAINFYLASVGATVNNILISNNVMFGNGNSNNLRYSGITPTNVVETSTIKIDPLLATETDFRLQEGSPAINTGLNLGLTSDYSGVSVDGSPNIGAYEITVPNTTRPFITTWNTENPGSATKTIVIPTITTARSYDCSVDWGDGNVIIYTGSAPTISHVYATSGIKTISISGNFPTIYFNNTGDKLKLLTIEQWGTGVWSAMYRSFYGCANLTGNYTDVPKTTLVKNFKQMFQSCVKFNSPVAFTTSAATTMDSMFMGCSLFNQSVSTFNTSNVTTMFSMFASCTAFNQSLANFDTHLVTTMNNMLGGCTSFKQSLASFNLLAATDIGNICNGCNINATGTTTNLDATYISWAAQTVKPSLTNVKFGTSKYSAGAAETARGVLTASPNLWVITDGGIDV